MNSHYDFNSPSWCTWPKLDRHVRVLKVARAGFIVRKWNNHIAATSKTMSVSRTIQNPSRKQKAEDAGWFGNVKHLRSQLYFETPRHFCNSSWHVNIVMLGPFWKTLAAVVQGRMEECVDPFDDGWWLFWRMETPVTAHIERLWLQLLLPSKGFSDSVLHI